MSLSRSVDIIVYVRIVFFALSLGPSMFGFDGGLFGIRIVAVVSAESVAPSSSVTVKVTL